VTRVRVAAAIAAILTALAFQAGVLGAVTMWVPISLPAVLVAAVALHDGAGTGIAFGFSMGLVADLGSDHPAGVFALTWMAIGMLCGLGADRSSVRRDALIAGGVCTVAATAASLLLALLGADGATFATAIRGTVPCLLGDLALAVVLIPLTRRFLSVDALRAPQPPPVLLGIDS
jgi:cell shape-determining protein MreD